MAFFRFIYLETKIKFVHLFYIISYLYSTKLTQNRLKTELIIKSLVLFEEHLAQLQRMDNIQQTFGRFSFFNLAR